MDIQMFGKISDAFGPSGFEEDVIRTIAGYCKEFELSNDAMNNLYARMPGASAELPVIQLDAHTDECRFHGAEHSGQRMPGDSYAWRISSYKPSGSFCMGQDKNRKNGSWNHLRKTGSFYDGCRARQSEP